MWSEGFYWGPIDSYYMAVFSQYGNKKLQLSGPLDEKYRTDLECRLKAIHTSWTEENIVINNATIEII